MKVRLGFVSNSSSSSYTCFICGASESGMDLCLEDIDMMECVNGHTFCISHKKDTTKDIEVNKRNYLLELKKKQTTGKYYTPERMKDDLFELLNMDEDEIDEVYEEEIADTGHPPEECPICQLSKITDHSIKDYIEAKLGLQRYAKDIQEKLNTFGK